MKKTLRLRLWILILSFSCTLPLAAQRRIYHLPDLDGRVTLKCDLHLHTVFSDGHVWPTVRVEEAWRDGLDAIAITDHIEYLPHKAYIPVDHNAAWKIAENVAREKNILLIQGAEITRKMPPGHFNALFISDAARLDQPEFLDVIKEAIGQKAFILWNHPGWKAQEPDGIPKLYDIHHQLLDKGWLHGIEFYNDVEYYPLVLDFCTRHNLAVLGNSDAHGVISEGYLKAPGDHRPMTLVFARERTRESLREALFKGETLVWFGEMLAGRETLAREFFRNGITVAAPFHENDRHAFVEITNHTEIPWLLVNGPAGAPGALTLPARAITRVLLPKTFTGPLLYDVKNIMTGETTVLQVVL